MPRRIGDLSKGGSLQGGESGPKDRSKEGCTCGENFSYNTWFVGGRSTYICKLQKDKSCIGYTQFAREKTSYVRRFPIR
jgi:hypothetical protein